MAGISGKATTVAIGTASSETDITAYCNSADVSRTVAMLLTTVFGDNDVERIAGLKDSSVKGNGLWSTAFDDIMDPLFGVDGKSIAIKPDGSTHVYRIGGFLAKWDVKSSVTGIVSADWEFACSGAVARS